MDNLNIHHDKSWVHFQLNSTAAGSLRVYIFKPGNNGLYCPLNCEVASVKINESDLNIVYRCLESEITITLNLKRMAAGYAGQVTVAGQGCVVVRLVWELPAGKKGFPFVPAFMYGFNEGGKSPDATYPQLAGGHNKIGFSRPWISDEWLVRADRSSHCFTSTIFNHMTCAIGGRDVCRYNNGDIAEKNGLGISSTDPGRLTFSLGFHNAPYTYSVVPGRNFISRPEGFIDLDKGPIKSELFLFCFQSKTRPEAAARLMRESYDLLRDPVGDAGTVGEAVTAIADRLVESGYCPEAGNFYNSFYDESQKNTWVLQDKFSSGWTGGTRTALPLLEAGHQLNKSHWLEPARHVLNNIADNAISKKSGLFFENYDLEKKRWDVQGWWYPVLENPGHSGYVNGHICYYLLRGFQIEKNNGTDRSNWLTAVRKVLDHVASERSADNRFGYTYCEETGSINDDIGFSGCWFVPAFALLGQITSDDTYLKIATEAMDAYRRDVLAFEVFGGPHDIWKSPDEEGILAWIEAAKLLHEMTGKKQFLEDLLLGLDVEFSWKFAYNVVNEIEPLKSLKWCSTGGSVTSVNNSHIHPMGSSIAPAIYYAYEQTNDAYLHMRFEDTMRWTLTLYLHHDGHYGWGKKGMINERFCYTDSLLLERFADGSPASTWFCGLNWASGAALEGLVGKVLDLEREKKTVDCAKGVL
jgi:hypothetical protein